jgi:hypothetical protein
LKVTFTLSNSMRAPKFIVTSLTEIILVSSIDRRR